MFEYHARGPTPSRRGCLDLPTIRTFARATMGRKRYVARSSTKQPSSRLTSISRARGSSSQSSAPAYTYQANLSGGRAYIGMAHTKSSLKARIATQLSGGPRASAVCKNNHVISVNRVYKHANVTAAKAAETKRYYSTKAALGADKLAARDTRRNLLRSELRAKESLCCDFQIKTITYAYEAS